MTRPDLPPIVCRARLEDDCTHGLPDDDPDDRACEDGTWDGESIVCDACYVRVMAFTPSGQGLTDELPRAIEVYSANRESAAHPDTSESFARSASAAAAMARAEVERRAAARPA